MSKLVLTEEEVLQIKALLDEVTSRYRSVEDPDFINEAGFLAQELPKRLRKFLHDFKTYEAGDGYCLISGLPIDEQKIGPTPDHWRKKTEVSTAHHEEVFFSLCAAQLGEIISWATQQDGYVINEVLPIKEYETEQLGFSSQQNLEWHVEDAFHPYRADYLGLMCLRNPTGTPTTLFCVDDIELKDEHRDALFEEHYTIRPDESHLEKNRATDKGPLNFEEDLSGSYDKINKMNSEPEKISVLFGDKQSPYWRLDPYFMGEPDTPEAKVALDALIQDIDAKMGGVVLQPGDFFFFDNFRVVHGRPPFKAKYDGNDRWLKRINVARDLRKSRASRRSSLSREIL